MQPSKKVYEPTSCSSDIIINLVFQLDLSIASHRSIDCRGGIECTGNLCQNYVFPAFTAFAFRDEHVFLSRWVLMFGVCKLKDELFQGMKDHFKAFNFKYPSPLSLFVGLNFCSKRRVFNTE